MDLMYTSNQKAAHEILKLLKGRSYWTKTNSIRISLDVSKDQHVTIRALLNKMKAAGLVLRRGVGSFEWKINVEEWTEENPFRNVRPIVPTDKSTPASPAYRPPMPSSGLTKMIEDVAMAAAAPAPAASQDRTLQLLLTRVAQLEEKVEELTKPKDDDPLILQLAKDLDEVRKIAEGNVRVLEIRNYGGKTVRLKDQIVPAAYQRTLDLAKCRRNVLLVGPAGCGKSFLAKLIADSLDLPFYKVGGSGGLQEHHLLGKSIPNLTGGKDRFRTTPFLQAFEKGGVCCVDELDGADQNVLLALNPALDDTKELPIPNRGDVARKHKDFVCVATANTVGRGATRMYSGRNQLDEATIDRFRSGIVECWYDPAIEMAVCPEKDLREKLQKIRDKIEATGLRRIMSTRFMSDMYVMHKEADWPVEACVETFFSGWTPEERAKILPL